MSRARINAEFCTQICNHFFVFDCHCLQEFVLWFMRQK
nr:MAG TPA: Glucagon-like peptide 1 receptor, Exendin-4-bound G protein-coupled receptor extracellular [Caudoviricetes sp.]